METTMRKLLTFLIALAAPPNAIARSDGNSGLT
jgi:hypothetical protein